MMTETARVVAINDGVVWVETLRQSSCNSCAARVGCGHGMVNVARTGTSRAIVPALWPHELELALEIDDTVEIAIPEEHFLRGVFLLYVVPLLGMLAGAVFADRFWVAASASVAETDLRVSLAAMMGLGAGVLLVRLGASLPGLSAVTQPRITAKV